jgi:hypothetical protein
MLGVVELFLWESFSRDLRKRISHIRRQNYIRLPNM